MAFRNVYSLVLARSSLTGLVVGLKFIIIRGGVKVTCARPRPRGI